ncbi:lipoprotein signal peptidase [Desulfoprunum benzoelyticum]|uniref:signal peptidase II n=1 Tax=Desulfoprunum benzoelyticum TaxID=1506996 RepID=UPI0016071EC1|nr:signal peptidase II [Desulfoprunum benzoelyticum]MBM9529042.1 lipoprotein signal peptidase [Desulfoprunum benzoelyticum]
MRPLRGGGWIVGPQPGRAGVIYTLVVFGAVVLDQLTKLWILRTFELYESREIIPGLFNLVYVTNTGAAFSILADVDSPWRHYFFLGIGLLATIGLTIYYYRLRAAHRAYAVALGLVVGGALGNLIDRLRLGSVVDFLDFHLAGRHWPAFNVADSAICVGAVLFLIISFVTEQKDSKE